MGKTSWRLCVTTWVFTLIFFIPILQSPTLGATGLPVVRIGIVVDGSPQNHGWGKVIRSKLVLREILKLTRGEFNIRFPKNTVVHGNWSVQGTKKAVDFLLADPNVDIILALGVLASYEVSRRSSLPKPVVAPFVIDRVLQGLPYRQGTSGVRNLNYLTLLRSFERSVKAFKEIIPFSNMTLLLDQALFEAFPELQVKVQKAAKENGIEITLVPVGTSIQPALEALPDGTEAVYVTPLLRISLRSSMPWSKVSLTVSYPVFPSLGEKKWSGVSWPRLG